MTEPNENEAKKIEKVNIYSVLLGMVAMFIIASIFVLGNTPQLICPEPKIDSAIMKIDYNKIAETLAEKIDFNALAPDYNMLMAITYFNTNCEKIGLETQYLPNQPIQTIVTKPTEVLNCQDQGGTVKEAQQDGKIIQYCEIQTYFLVCVERIQ